MKNGSTTNAGAMGVKVQTLENAVRRLAPKELESFREWFSVFDAKAWDRQIEADVKSGRLNDVSARALADHRHGKSRDL